MGAALMRVIIVEPGMKTIMDKAAMVGTRNKSNKEKL